VTRQNEIVRHRSRLKNIVQSILHSHLIPLARTPTSAGERTGMVFSPGLAGKNRLDVQRGGARISWRSNHSTRMHHQHSDQTPSRLLKK
jgi:hypothetical protein